MGKKNFDTQKAADKFFTHITQNTDNTYNTDVTQNTQNAYSTHDTHSTQERKPLRKYRYNLALDADLNEFLHEIAWQNRTSMTQYINDLIRREMEKYNKSK